ncbi:MAG: stage II sporulation protein R, partial [Clostridia bacterium]|nr:stage II sporulation protein R [Clostridia bacterium]
LHVIAESDSEEDQALKLKVRDAVLACVSGAVGACGTFDEAYAAVEGMRDEILTAAQNCVEKNGSDAAVSLALGKEAYPRRDYGNAVLPAGVYPSLRIILGEGDGKNWWCVLFPTVCVRFAKAGRAADEDAYVAAGFTPEEYRIITGAEGKLQVRFRILEVLSELFSRKETEKIT